jgi:carbon storage regulator
MLVLSRKCDETIFIGDDISVTVTRISHDKVRLGISAPPAVQVLRAELRDERRRSPAGAAEEQDAERWDGFS